MKKLLFVLSIFLTFSSCSNEAKGCNFTDDYCAADYEVQNPCEEIALDAGWKFASFSKINTGKAFLYKASENRNGIVIAVNAGHGTAGGSSVMTYSHPDKSPKLTGGTNAQGAVESMAVSGGMTFECGISESEINLRVAVILRKLLLESGFDVLMIRSSDDVQLDNIARTVISNNNADVHIAIHFDGDGKSYDKGCFYCGIPSELKFLENVKAHYEESERLGRCLVNGLKTQGIAVYGAGRGSVDLTQTSYSTIPTVDIELGNQCTIPLTAELEARAKGLVSGVLNYFKL